MITVKINASVTQTVAAAFLGRCAEQGTALRQLCASPLPSSYLQFFIGQVCVESNYRLLHLNECKKYELLFEMVVGLFNLTFAVNSKYTRK